MSNIVLVLWHSIEEYDQVRLLSSIGHNVFSLGAYSDPANPGDDKRPALPEVQYFPDLKAATDRCYAQGIEPKQALPDEVLDWADIIIYHHHLPDLFAQWEARVGPWLQASWHRVIWRTVGQSVTANEDEARPFRGRGLEIVRYSPKERGIPGYVGEDAVIRFYKDPGEWSGWIGDERIVTNVSQDLRRRDVWCNFAFWAEATANLPAVPMGPGSEEIGGTGTLPWEAMRDRLRHARCYLYTGTQPASYTLGLIEAMMLGIPVVSIGPEYMTVFPYGPALFEGHELATIWADGPAGAERALRSLLNDEQGAREVSEVQRYRAIELFGRERIAQRWQEYLR